VTTPSTLLRARVFAFTLRLLALAAALAGALNSSAAAAAEAAYVVRNWRVDDGLPHNTVNRVIQDRRGFLWLATGAGIARFDGLQFDEWPLPRASRDASYNIRDLALEHDDAIAFLPASGGILRLKEGNISPHPAAAAFPDRQLVQLFAEPGGALWVVAGGQGLARWENGVVKQFGAAEGLNRRGHRVSFAIDERRRVWIASGDFIGWFEAGALHRAPWNLGAAISIAPARQGGLWILGNGISRLENETLRTIAPPEQLGEQLTALQDMFEHPDGALWFASRRHGVSRFASGRLEPVPASHEQVVALTADQEGNIWVSTSGGGLDRLRPRPFVRHDAGSGLPDKISSSVCDDAQGTLWLANRRGGLVRLGPEGTQTFRPAGLPGEFFANVVTPAADGAIWVGAEQGVFRFDGRALAPVAENLRGVHVLFCARNGDLWIGAGENRLAIHRGGALRMLGAAEGYKGRRVKALAEDSKGRIYVATDDREVFEWSDGRLVPAIEKNEMPGGLIYAAYCDGEDALWLATSHGVVLRRGGRLHHFTVAEGLADDLVSQILPDAQGRLWFGSRRGIFTVERAELIAIAEGRAIRANAVMLGKDEGLVGASTLNNTQPMAWAARDGRLWFTTYEGTVGIDPSRSLPRLAPPRIYIDRVAVNEEPVGSAGEIKIGPGDRRLDVRLAALNLSAPDRVRVRHRLKGYDDDWLETGPDHRVVYQRLPPGRYTLEASAANQDGRWTAAPATLAVVVLPSWWQTWWARGCFIGAFTAGVAGAARFWSVRRLRRRLDRLEREHALEQERARIARDLHDDLGGSLTQIGLLAERVRRQTAEPGVKPALGQLAWRTRRLADELESIVWTVSPKNNTWDKLALFIDQYVRSFCRDTSLACTIEGAEKIPPEPLSPEAQHNILSVVKEALNNTLKHAQATRVEVLLDAAGGVFELQVADNGIGFDPGAAEHAERNGLTNMRTRIADLGGTIEIRSRPGAGTRLRIQQPMHPPPALRPA
jgi:signal transduction histidine kinase/ligand-binding sensor domain-containing protein